MAATRKVLDHHLQSFADGDLDGIMSDYAPDAVLFTADGVLRGADAIRSLFVAMLAEFGKPGADFRLGRAFVDGDHAFIVWSAETADRVYEFVADTYFVRSGRIAVQTFAGKVTPRA